MELIREIDDDYKIKQPKDILKYVEEFRNQDREFLIILGLDTKNKVMYRDIVSIGTLNASLVHPREVFKSAVMKSANSIIMVHNHPSDGCMPSTDDINVRDKLRQAGEILGIKLLDIIIITKSEVNSY